MPDSPRRSAILPTRPSYTLLGKHRQIGANAEEQAAVYLQTQGLCVLDRNFRVRGGELDLVMLHDQCVVFVEVRSRACATFGDAAESIHFAKRRRLRLAAQFWLLQHPRYQDVPCRFDCIAITAGTLRWIPHAFLTD